MCGIAGIFHFNEGSRPERIKRMTRSLYHRGPDDEGFLAVNFESGKTYPLTGKESELPGLKLEEFNEPAHLLLGHRRLSIIDLSPLGHQPMSNNSGTLWIVHNGEVYNYLEIRKELETLGYNFKSKTDTEVILHAYEAWGVDCLNRFNGMWAFAIIDLKNKRIFCSRDRAGVKPLYYLYDEKKFCFASEIKSLLEIDDFRPEPNEQIIADYLFSGLVDHTHETFFKNIYQLRPGEYLLFEDKKLTIRSYWDIETKEIHFRRENDYAVRFYELLEDSIRLRLRTDVPIGTCLSGGLDSSSIVCLANRLMFDGQNIDPKLVGRRQKTFSSCFDDPACDERKFIELVVRQTGAEKNYVFPDEKDFLKNCYQLIRHQDEPFGSTSMYAQWKVMGLAREKQITVLLDGQGGDELLAGYMPSFYHLFNQVRKDFNIGLLMKEGRGFVIHHQNQMGRIFYKILSAMVPKRLWMFFPRLDRDGEAGIEEGFKKNYYRTILSPIKFEHELNNYLYQIFRYTVLPGLLRYEDRNSMAFSLEARLPLLDYRLVEYCFSLPPHLKIDGGVTKVILRKAMRGNLPEGVRNRMDKIGFGTPEEIWFRTGLRKWIEQIISSKSFAERGYFNVPQIKRIFLEYCQNKRNNHFLVWRWINLELWLRMFVDQKTSSQTWDRYEN